MNFVYIKLNKCVYSICKYRPPSCPCGAYAHSYILLDCRTYIYLTWCAFSYSTHSDKGFRGHGDINIALCLDRTIEFLENLPVDSCYDTNKAFDKEVMGRGLNSTMIDLSGVACSCSHTGCNDPRSRYILQTVINKSLLKVVSICPTVDAVWTYNILIKH